MNELCDYAGDAVSRADDPCRADPAAAALAKKAAAKRQCESALEYLEYSIRDRGYRFSQPQEFRERRAILEFYIKSLQDGKIRPEFPPDILNRFFHPDVLNNS